MSTLDSEIKPSKLKSTLNWLTDALFPRRFLKCGYFDTWLCFKCLSELQFKRQLHCPACTIATTIGEFCNNCKTSHFLNGVWSAQPYGNKLIKQLIHDLKFEYISEIADHLGHLMVVALQTFTLPPAWHAIPKDKWQLVPIPLANNRLRKRGYNQALKLSEKVSAEMNLEIIEILERTRDTLQQSKLAPELKNTNLKNAFQIKSGINLNGGAFILVDDVYTSGATLEEAARILKQAGASEVWGLTAAYG